MLPTQLLVVCLLFLHFTSIAGAKDKDETCKEICKFVDVKHCNCPNSQLPSWHRRKRRQVSEECKSLEEKHNKFVEGVTAVIDDLVSSMYGDDGPQEANSNNTD